MDGSGEKRGESHCCMLAGGGVVYHPRTKRVIYTGESLAGRSRRSAERGRVVIVGQWLETKWKLCAGALPSSSSKNIFLILWPELVSLPHTVSGCYRARPSPKEGRAINFLAKWEGEEEERGREEEPLEMMFCYFCEELCGISASGTGYGEPL